MVGGARLVTNREEKKVPRVRKTQSWSHLTLSEKRSESFKSDGIKERRYLSKVCWNDEASEAEGTKPVDVKWKNWILLLPPSFDFRKRNLINDQAALNINPFRPRPPLARIRFRLSFTNLLLSEGTFSKLFVLRAPEGNHKFSSLFWQLSGFAFHYYVQKMRQNISTPGKLLSFLGRRRVVCLSNNETQIPGHFVYCYAEKEETDTWWMKRRAFVAGCFSSSSQAFQVYLLHSSRCHCQRHERPLKWTPHNGLAANGSKMSLIYEFSRESYE